MAVFHHRRHNLSLPGYSWSSLRFLVIVLVPLTMLSACTLSRDQQSMEIENVLHGVAAVSATDVWTVGGMSNPSSRRQVLIEHWNGRQWQTVPSSTTGSLSGIAAVTANDVWAVGYTLNMMLTMHWDGTHWSQIPGPSLSYLSSAQGGALSAVAAVSSHDVWAVGEVVEPQGDVPVISHWDGQRWHTVSPAFPPGFRAGALSSLQAIASTNVWAVGWYSDTKNSMQYPLAEHWDGQSWLFVPTPDDVQDHRLLGAITFSGLATLSSENLWAVGKTELPSVNTSRTLVEHWNGSRWQVVDTPMPSSAAKSYPQHIFAVTAQNLWMMGYWYSPKTSTKYPLLLHWDGQGWHIATPPSLQTTSGVFFAGTAVAAHDLWVVGSSGSVFAPAPSSGTIDSHTLIEHWDGTRWSTVPSPNPGQPIPVFQG